MTGTDFPSGSGAAPDGEPHPEAEGSAAHAADPTPESGDAAAPELTIDDILNAFQQADATAEDDLDQAADRVEDLESTLLTDLKRLQAEYANYRRRTEEQRELEALRAKGSVAAGLLPVLDDLDRAQKHGDLPEGSAFAAIADKLRAVAGRIGIESYGSAGEVFDPQQHEAIFQQPTPGITETTILEVVETGYRLGAVELRPAKVVVAVPADPSTSSGTVAGPEAR